MIAKSIPRLALAAFLGGSTLLTVGCGGASTAAPSEAKEGGGTPTLFDNPPLGDPLAPSQAELNARRPARKAATPRR